MPEPSLVEQVATLNSTLGAIEGRLARGQTPTEGLEDFKSALDDMRLRLWGLLSATGGGDSRAFQERFRIRRATEMCRSLSGDLKSGSVSGRHGELTALQQAVAELERSIDLARQHAY
jgi:hypothetical protein